MSSRRSVPGVRLQWHTSSERCGRRGWPQGRERGASVCHPPPPVSLSPDLGKGEEDAHALCLSDVLSTELDISFRPHK